MGMQTRGHVREGNSQIIHQYDAQIMVNRAVWGGSEVPVLALLCRGLLWIGLINTSFIERSIGRLIVLDL